MLFSRAGGARPATPHAYQHASPIARSPESSVGATHRSVAAFGDSCGGAETPPRNASGEGLASRRLVDETTPPVCLRRKHGRLGTMTGGCTGQHEMGGARGSLSSSIRATPKLRRTSAKILDARCNTVIEAFPSAFPFSSLYSHREASILVMNAHTGTLGSPLTATSRSNKITKSRCGVCPPEVFCLVSVAWRRAHRFGGHGLRVVRQWGFEASHCGWTPGRLPRPGRADQQRGDFAANLGSDLAAFGQRWRVAGFGRASSGEVGATISDLLTMSAHLRERRSAANFWPTLGRVRPSLAGESGPAFRPSWPKMWADSGRARPGCWPR